MKENRVIVSGFLLVLLIGCGSDSYDPEPPEDELYTAFSNHQQVTITGYSGDIMEPFISRDGSTLFFNNNGPNKDLYYASFVNLTTFQYEGALPSVNTSAVEGAPSMDSAGNFYFVTTAFYNPPSNYHTIYTGQWNGSSLNHVSPAVGLAMDMNGFLNFDIEISADGNTAYFNDGDFRGGNNFPDDANIAIALKSGSEFIRDVNSTNILINVNTTDLEYAPAISADQLELFFTRLYLSNLTTEFFRATRNSINESFTNVQKVDGLSGFIEGTAYSPDERSLYYHKRNDTTGAFELYVMTRN